MRIGTNHGSLSDRIMSRYGDTPMGMVESAMEFLRIARGENYHQIILSMKASNPQVMVHAYRLLVKTMFEEFGECYPLHLGVTEAGDGEDGRIKSAVGIGTLMEDGLGDTIRVSLTEEPELEIPVCKNLVKRFEVRSQKSEVGNQTSDIRFPYSPFEYYRRETFAIDNIGGKNVPIVIADLSKIEKIIPADLKNIGYAYDEKMDKWHINDAAADFVFTANQLLDFELPGTLKVIVYHQTWLQEKDKEKYFPIFEAEEYSDNSVKKSPLMNFVMVDCYSENYPQQSLNKILERIKNDRSVVICLSSTNSNAMQSIRRMFVELINNEIKNPVVLITDSNHDTTEEALIHYAVETGALFLDGLGDGICLGYHFGNNKILTDHKWLNSIAFGILQATRTRISKTEYISCPSCGRTLFELQETTAKIRAVTNHLKGVKIAIMGCIVNGPGEMADADFGYVGSGPGKITLYKGKEIVKRNVNTEIAVDELLNLLKENDAWIEPS
jgi:(E)-4-hydroxy-3-methylbut-2-enyl-diphosphate synthase